MRIHLERKPNRVNTLKHTLSDVKKKIYTVYIKNKQVINVYGLCAIVSFIVSMALITDGVAFFQIKNSSSKEIDPFEILMQLEKKEARFVIVDIRSPKEYASAHIKGAVNVPSYVDYKDIKTSKVDHKEFISTFYKAVEGKSDIVFYSYWPKANIAQEYASIIFSRYRRAKMLSISFYEFKNIYYEWLPGGDMAEPLGEKYLEGSAFQQTPAAVVAPNTNQFPDNKQ